MSHIPLSSIQSKFYVSITVCTIVMVFSFNSPNNGEKIKNEIGREKVRKRHRDTCLKIKIFFSLVDTGVRRSRCPNSNTV